MPGTSLWSRNASAWLRTGQTPTISGTAGGPPSRSRNRSSWETSKSTWVIAKRAPASIFRAKRSISQSGSSATGFTATPTWKLVASSIALPA